MTPLEGKGKIIDRFLARSNRRARSLKPNLRFQPDSISESFVRLVDIIFGVIIAQGFILFRDRIVAVEVSIGTGSLLLVYVTILHSWLGYHKSVKAYAYNRTAWSRFRLAFDIFILLLYAYLLFVALDLHKVLLGLAAVFVLYALAGIVRRVEWRDSKVAKPWLAVGIAFVFVGLWSAAVRFPQYDIWWLLIAFVLLFSYRIVRPLLGYPMYAVGIDVDGVLAEQVTPILDRLRAQGKARGLTKDNITDWNFKIDDTDIAKEIEAALLDPQYVLEMPVQPGSTNVMQEMYERYHVVIATSRPVETQQATIEWVKKSFRFHEFANTRQVGKANLGLNLLIDDNIDNAKSFALGKGTAILFSQPWNMGEDDEMKQLIANRTGAFAAHRNHYGVPNSDKTWLGTGGHDEAFNGERHRPPLYWSAHHFGHVLVR